MKKTGFDKPSRRAFIGLLGAAAAAVAVVQVAGSQAEPERSAGVSKTRWIGHC